MNELEKQFLITHYKPVARGREYYCDDCHDFHIPGQHIGSPLSYADIKAKRAKVAEDPNKLAPVTARPKYSKGDNPRYRFKNDTVKLRQNKLLNTVDGHNQKKLYRLTATGIKRINKDA